MNAVSKIEGSTALSTGSDNAYLAYGQAQTQRTIVGDLLKFSKGEYLVGQNDEEMAEGTRLVANMEELLIGWIKWEDGKPSEQEMGRIVDGYTPPRRKDLGDTDETDWEVDTNGAPRDPWNFTNYLVMKEESGDKLFTFTTSSRGGLNAIGELCKVYGKEMRQRPNDYPIVALKVSSYRHSKKEYGKIFVPVLEVVGWAPKGDFVGPMAAVVDSDGDGQGSQPAKAKTAPAPATRF